jgi:twitching motility protein PilT
VSQRLLPTADGSGRVPAMEILVATGRVFDKIADPDATHELEEIIAEGGFYGMQTFDQSLFGLYERGLVSRRDALATATHNHDLRLQMDHLEMERAQARESTPVAEVGG